MSMNEGHFGSSNEGEHPMGTSKVSHLLLQHIIGKGQFLPARHRRSVKQAQVRQKYYLRTG